MNLNGNVFFKLNFILALFLSASLSVAGKMAYRPTHLANTSELITELKSRKVFTEEEKKIFLLLNLGSDLVDLKEIRVEGRKDSNGKSSLKSLKLHRIIESIEDRINSDNKKYWSRNFLGAKRSQILKKRSLLKETLGGESYLWAWFLNGLKQKSRAKNILKEKLNSEYEKVLSLKRATFRSRRKGPLHSLLLVANALREISDESEKVEIQEKVKKAKVHMSSMPQLNIMT
jgi:hypothetical protein